MIKQIHIKQFSIKYSLNVNSSITKLNGSKYCYASLTIQSNISHFVYTQLNDQTVLFQTIQFNMSTQFKF